MSGCANSRRGENFEIDTPHLAFRAAQPGDYRIDVDPARGTTRVTVRSGMALVYGASGQAVQLQAGQQLVLCRPRSGAGGVVQAALRTDGFDRWAADRNRQEDQSIAARYLPRDVVGYAQLDPNGNWAQDPSYGAGLVSRASRWRTGRPIATAAGNGLRRGAGPGSTTRPGASRPSTTDAGR